MVRRGRPPLGLPTGRSIRLGRELRRLREQHGLSQGDVVKRAGGAVSKLSHIESGERTISEADLAGLLTIYSVTSESDQWNRLVALAASATVKDWWDEYSEHIEPAFTECLGLEDVAARISTFQTSLIPTLLQTSDYARAVEQARHPYRSPNDVDTAVAITRRRQAVLTRAGNPAVLEAVLDESSLRREVGGRRVTAEQLSHLATLGETPNVTLRVLPFSAGAWRSPASSFSQFTLTDTAGAETGVLCIEHVAGVFYLDDSTSLRRFADSFEDAQTKALTPGESAELIGQLAESP